MTRASMAVALAGVLMAGTLAACAGDDEPDASATFTRSAEATTEAATPAPSRTAVSPEASPTRRATTAAPRPSQSPTDDENGELAGQLIIEYPGKPLRRTSSTASNPDVVDLQVRLNEVGYPVDTDGVFDAGTERVVIAFQRDNGLTADGIVGPTTWAALFTFG
jgi:peptidoglycan hydrolase-like protein with peptidoglycan-binding domain